MGCGSDSVARQCNHGATVIVAECPDVLLGLLTAFLANWVVLLVDMP
jgi:hypothetical protein